MIAFEASSFSYEASLQSTPESDLYRTCPFQDALPTHAEGLCTPSFVSLPLAKKKGALLFFSNSFWSSSERRTNKSSPNTPLNMLPLTNADRLPNMGRRVIPRSLGSMDLKKSIVLSLAFGIFKI